MSKIRSFGRVLPGIQYKDRPGAYAFMVNGAGLVAVVRMSFGTFLPGGGLDPGEDELTALRRELLEEIGYELTVARIVLQAEQYHWSAFYNSHFRKIGSFFEVEARPIPGCGCEPEHSLLWLPGDEAVKALSQEFQSWALREFLGS